MNATDIDAGQLLAELATLAPEQQLDRVRALGSADSIVHVLADHIESLSISDLANADDSSLRLARLADALGHESARARAHRARGHVLAYCNRYDEALDTLNQAAHAAELGHQPVEAARARLAMLHAYARLSRYDEAIEAGELARDAFDRAGETLLTAKAEINLGVTFRMRDDPAQALLLFDRGRPALERNPVMLAQLDSNRAEAMLDLHQFAQAEQTFLGALQTFEKHGMRRAAAIVEGNLADMMSRQGRLQRALYHFERARRHLEVDAAP